jgi:hypothetical protein
MTSTVFISLEEGLTLDELARFLGKGISILSFINRE